MQRFHPLFDPYRRRREEGTALFDRLCAGAASLEGTVIVWHGACKRLDGDVTRDAFVEVMLDLGERCRQHGLALAVENVSWCNLATVRDVLALLPDLPADDSIGFTFDPFQAAEADTNPFMLLAAMEGRLLNVHLRDFDEEHPKQTVTPAGRRQSSLGRFDPGDQGRWLRRSDDARRLTPARPQRPVLTQFHRSSRRSSPTWARRWIRAEAPLPPGVLEGIRLFNQGAFYECHEVIEHEWHAERGPIRALYQGILQIGVGFHHARGGNYRGAVALLTDGIEKVSRFQPACRKVDTAKLVAQSTTLPRSHRSGRAGPDRCIRLDESPGCRTDRLAGTRFSHSIVDLDGRGLRSWSFPERISTRSQTQRRQTKEEERHRSAKIIAGASLRQLTWRHCSSR